MSEYKVESGVPVPRLRASNKYPWGDMNPGDSFVVSIEHGNSARQAGNNWCHKYNPGLRCTVRREGDGYRVWLVSRNGKK